VPATSDRRAALGLAALFSVTGTCHFLAADRYEAIVPPALPGSARGWVVVSGNAELACAAALAIPRTRRLGATLSVLLLVVMFPANVQMALDWRHQGTLKAGIAWARLPLQAPLIWWAWHVRRTSD
jgi:uncharacterized membrane protein